MQNSNNLNKSLKNNNDKSKNLSLTKFTIDDAIEHFGFGKFQLFLTCFAGLAWV